MTTKLQQTLNQLESLGHEKVRAQNLKHGATKNQFGVKLGDIRKVAAKIKSDDSIEAEMGDADPRVQWTMNFSLGGIGIQSEKHRERAIAIGEKLWLYRDYPVSKGCTSPYVPTWVCEIVSREKGRG